MQTRLESFPPLAFRSRLDKVVRLVTCRLARCQDRVPFSRSENRQGLDDRCCCAGALTETRGCGCVGHSDLSFPPCSMKQPCVQRGPFAGESAIRIVFNKKETPRQVGQMDEFLSHAIHAVDLT